MSCSSRKSCISSWGVVIEDVTILLGLGWPSPLILGLIRDKMRSLLRGQVILSILREEMYQSKQARN
jgi:hypothetical protein